MPRDWSSYFDARITGYFGGKYSFLEQSRDASGAFVDAVQGRGQNGAFLAEELNGRIVPVDAVVFMRHFGRAGGVYGYEFEYDPPFGGTVTGDTTVTIGDSSSITYTSSGGDILTITVDGSGDATIDYLACVSFDCLTLPDAPPSSPQPEDVYIDPTTGIFYYWSGTTWVPPGATAVIIDGYPVSTLPPVSGQVLTFDGVEWTPVTPGGPSAAVPQWTKVRKTHTDLNAAATTNDIEIYAAARGTYFDAVVMKTATPFSGGGIAVYNLSIGYTGFTSAWINTYDGTAAVSDTNDALFTPNGFANGSFAANSIRLAASCTGANLSAATAGAVDIWLRVSVLP